MLVYVDDATGRLMELRFVRSESPERRVPGVWELPNVTGYSEVHERTLPAWLCTPAM